MPSTKTKIEANYNNWVSQMLHARANNLPIPPEPIRPNNHRAETKTTETENKELDND